MRLLCTPGQAATCTLLSVLVTTSVAWSSEGSAGGERDIVDQQPAGMGDAEKPSDWTFEAIALPIYTQSPDAGPTALLASSIYLHDGVTAPFKLYLSAVASVSLFGVATGTAFFEWVRPNGTPLRLLFSAGYQSNLAGNYCGTGNAVTCDLDVAQRAADGLQLEGDARANFVRRYYQYRVHGPTASASLRWAVRNLPHRVEAVAGMRSAYFFPGSFGFAGITPRPYGGSHYAQAFPQGEAGLLNIVEVGLMADNRDDEAVPTRGYWVEGSLRSASMLTLSAWNYGGVNLIARGYLPLRPEGRLVLAQRAIVDVMVGDVPTYELQRIGGSWALGGFGGLNLGRGIREGRFMGRIKVISQTELRLKLMTWTWFGVPVDLGVAGFVDAAWVGLDWNHIGGDLLRINPSFGGGLRLRIMKNLLFRIELGFSPAENFAPQPYLWPAWPF